MHERARTNCAGLLVATCVLMVAVGPRSVLAEQDLALVGGTLYTAPGAPAVVDGVVIIRRGRIAAVGPKEAVSIRGDTEILDCSGLSVAAGFWNNHVHLTPSRLLLAGWLPEFFSANAIREMLTRHGFTHVLDTGSLLGSTVRLRRRIANGRFAGPEILVAGGRFVPVNGSPYYLTLPLPELATPAEAREAVTEVLEDGANGIKLFTGGLVAHDSVIVMDVAIIRAATDAAHERGAFVVAHPSSSAGARAALEGGVDILAHTFPTETEEPWDRSLLPLMRQREMALIPTIKLWKYEFERAGRSADDLAHRIRVAQDQVQMFASLGGQILFGTDVGYMSDSDPTDEYVYLAGAGLTFPQILATLTTAPAERFGAASHAGRIAPEMDADLVVFEGNPETDIRSLARIRHVLRGGKVVYSAR